MKTDQFECKFSIIRVYMLLQFTYFLCIRRYLSASRFNRANIFHLVVKFRDDVPDLVASNFKPP